MVMAKKTQMELDMVGFASANVSEEVGEQEGGRTGGKVEEGHAED